MKSKLLCVTICLLCMFLNINAQKRISVNANSYGEKFIGNGASCGLYIGHYLSMSQENQLEASRLLFEDLKLNYIKEYVDDVPEVDGALYNKISTFVNNAKIYNPDLQFVLCANNLPDELEETDSDGDPIKGEHDETIPDIFDKIAEYYFKACEGYYLRGHKVDILELVNERGYDDGKVTDLFDFAATKFKALINDPSVNVYNIPMPLIMGPSTWSAASPTKFINGWKSERPNAWVNCDLVATHGYENSTESNYQATYDISEGKTFFQSEQTGKIQKGEDEGVDVLGEQFPDGVSPGFVNDAAIAKHMIDFFNGGGNSFWAFLANTHKTDHNAGLIGTSWGGAPGPTNIYYGFKHLSATHPLNSKRVDRDLTGIDTNYFKTVSFRKEGENTVYVHILNMYETDEQVTVDFNSEGIKQLKVIRTDENSEFSEIENKSFSTPLAEYVINTTPYSVTTLEVLLDGTSTTTLQTQSITFNKIDDVLEDVADFDITPTASSGLPVTIEVVEGSAVLSGSTLSINDIGLVRVRATQEGNDEYYEALPVEHLFYVRSTKDNIALDKTATASSQRNTTYIPSKAIDGDKTDNSSRWLNDKSVDDFSEDPQWIEVDFGANYEISGMGMYCGYNNGTDIYKNPIYEFDFQVWNHVAQIWETVLSEEENMDPTYLKSLAPVITNKVRLYMADAPKDYLVKLFELEVFGEYDSEVSEETVENVALNKTATVNYGDGSYTHHNSNTPAGAVDGITSGDNSGRWLFRYDNHPLPVELEIDLGDNYNISAYSIFEDDSNSSFTSEYILQYWDNSNWVNIVEKTEALGNQKTQHNIINESFTEVTTSRVKLIFNKHTQSETTASKYYIRFYELEIYGESASLLNANNYNKSMFATYPNPSKDIIYLRSNNNESINNVLITDVRGSVLKEFSNKQEIDVSNLKTGVYFIIINRNFKSKFIKQ